MPRPLQLQKIQSYVVSEAVIINPCAKEFYDPKQFKEDGTEKYKRPKMDHPEGLLNDKGKVIRVCKLGKENPDWPEGYTYLDRFLDEMKTQNNGDVLFVATTVGDYKVMAEDMQELKRYIKQIGEVVIYYRNVTINDEDAVGVKVKKK